jgi:hypothetical protein
MNRISYIWRYGSYPSCCTFARHKWAFEATIIIMKNRSGNLSYRSICGKWICFSSRIHMMENSPNHTLLRKVFCERTTFAREALEVSPPQQGFESILLGNQIKSYTQILTQPGGWNGNTLLTGDVVSCHGSTDRSRRTTQLDVVWSENCSIVCVVKFCNIWEPSVVEQKAE